MNDVTFEMTDGMRNCVKTARLRECGKMAFVALVRWERTPTGLVVWRVRRINRTEATVPECLLQDFVL